MKYWRIKMNEHGLDINENDMKSLIKIAIDFYEYELDVMVNDILCLIMN